MLDGEQLVGLLLIRVTTVWWRTGPFWRRRWVDAQELPEWALSPVGPGQGTAGPDDGLISAEELDEELADWSMGVFRLGDRRYVLDWLGREETDVLHSEFGWTGS
ncbi:hypothetical protein [Streptomyces sp. SP18CS02]|uniref:hypothetical protein n=1 Tax=Streptomyces sp. SP18CS02 TaxID=3002531 RepID=UPI002E790E93|nr:hypothetical protein [Streptomyces sp. SP18CS02]MEE1753139.1 hypothetical protein [Streptomyces sp. SP18CS02]